MVTLKVLIFVRECLGVDIIDIIVTEPHLDKQKLLKTQ